MALPCDGGKEREILLLEGGEGGAGFDEGGVAGGGAGRVVGVQVGKEITHEVSVAGACFEK